MIGLVVVEVLVVNVVIEMLFVEVLIEVTVVISWQ